MLNFITTNKQEIQEKYEYLINSDLFNNIEDEDYFEAPIFYGITEDTKERVLELILTLNYWGVYNVKFSHLQYIYNNISLFENEEEIPEGKFLLFIRMCKYSNKNDALIAAKMNFFDILSFLVFHNKEIAISYHIIEYCVKYNRIDYINNITKIPDYTNYIVHYFWNEDMIKYLGIKKNIKSTHALIKSGRLQQIKEGNFPIDQSCMLFAIKYSRYDIMLYLEEKNIRYTHQLTRLFFDESFDPDLQIIEHFFSKIVSFDNPNLRCKKLYEVTKLFFKYFEHYENNSYIIYNINEDTIKILNFFKEINKVPNYLNSYCDYSFEILDWIVENNINLVKNLSLENVKYLDNKRYRFNSNGYLYEYEDEDEEIILIMVKHKKPNKDNIKTFYYNRYFKVLKYLLDCGEDIFEVDVINPDILNFFIQNNIKITKNIFNNNFEEVIECFQILKDYGLKIDCDIIFEIDNSLIDNIDIFDFEITEEDFLRTIRENRVKILNLFLNKKNEDLTFLYDIKLNREMLKLLSDYDDYFL